MLRVASRRLLPRQRTAGYFALGTVLLLYLFLYQSRRAGYRIAPWERIGITLGGPLSPGYDYTDVENIPDPDNKERQDALKKQYQQEHDELGKKPGAGSLYGNTIATLVDGTEGLEDERVLNPSGGGTPLGKDQPRTFNPYPKYNSLPWSASHAKYVPCLGPTGVEVRDIAAYKGRPYHFPDPKFGSYSIFDIDPNMCFERETRLSPYGLSENDVIDWDKVNWGELQDKCVERNQARFNKSGPRNPFLAAYGFPEPSESPEGNDGDGASEESEESQGAQEAQEGQRGDAGADEAADNRIENGGKPDHPMKPHRRGRHPQKGDGRKGLNWALGLLKSGSGDNTPRTEPRTALLLRSFSGKQYSENDKQVIRSLVTELSLRSGGEFQVFLFVHAKTPYDIWANEETYKYVVSKEVPKEFWDMTILWNDAIVQEMYPALNHPEEATVHNAQWLSVQRFIQENREFDYVWNWEMDSRLMGHNYDFLTKLANFAKKQPRKGLWERNERFYIPSVHGDYNTDFREKVETLVGDNTVWGPVKLPFVQPVGPTPPVESPADDHYHWGVGEEADLITLSPMFNPIHSSWILANLVWGYSDASHPSDQLPRRSTIITQSRVSRRLLDIMHVENLRGNHVGSEMTPQTVALLHGLKGVYAPMPVYFDRDWEGSRLAKWFNGGPRGQSGGYDSAMGWGREGRYTGSTWYYRADPPQRLYNNWMGYEDTGIGGEEWEKEHGRPCLPAMFLHPIKDVHPTGPGYESNLKLPYG